MAEEIRLRIQEWGHPLPEIGDDSPEGTLWSFWLELDQYPHPYLVWCEHVVGSHRRLLNRVRWRNAEQESAARSCRWVVGLEGPLSPCHPTTDYRQQLQLCDAISRGWAPVVYDANAFLFRTPEDLRYLITPKTAPRTAALYTIHQLRCNQGDAEAKRFWLHTHGLERAGVPDLELFNVPERLVPAGCELLEAVADLWIAFTTPDPQVPATIGQDLQVAWRPWQAAVAEMPSSSIGGWEYRRREAAHDGYRAVLVESQPKGWIHRRWVPPVPALEKLTDARTTLYKTVAETRRMADLARERWSTFGLLFASRPPRDWRFAVKLSYPMPDEPRHHEHLWFDVVGLKPDRIRATLVSQPTHVNHLEIGETSWHSLSQLSDWRIFTPEGVFDPESADLLLEESLAV